MKVKIINKSAKAIPEEATNAIMFKNLDMANSILEQYNLKAERLSNNIVDGELIEQELTIISM